MHEDLKQAEDWEQVTNDIPMDLRHIASLAALGFEHCEDFCSSRHVCGEHRCVCIRDAFPTPAHYELYLLMRSQYKQLIAYSVASTGAGYNGEDTNNG